MRHHYLLRLDTSSRRTVKPSERSGKRGSDYGKAEVATPILDFKGWVSIYVNMLARVFSKGSITDTCPIDDAGSLIGIQGLPEHNRRIFEKLSAWRSRVGQAIPRYRRDGP